MDPRLAARVDPSDVMQESLATAAQRLSDYILAKPLPFYLGLRQIALERLIDAERRPVRSQERSVRREELRLNRLPDDSVEGLARLASRGSSPSRALQRRDTQERMRAALERLPERGREVLLWRPFEQLPVKEIAAILGIRGSGGGCTIHQWPPARNRVRSEVGGGTRALYNLIDPR